MTTISPYGTWRSPISARDIAAGGHPVQGGCWVGDQPWWCEGRPEEGGRYVVANAGGDVLPGPWNARSRVHEYGGGAWAVTADRALVFVEFSDQRLYRLDDGGSIPVPLTPAGRGFRFGDISIRGSEVIAVREIHADGAVTRDIVAVQLDGTGAVDSTASFDSTAAVEDPGIRSLASGSHFLAFPRFSPDGARLAWIGWEHPQMPWDGTELRVTELESGRVETLAGSVTESVLQPEWIDDATLSIVSDRSGWWNLYSVTVHGEVATLHREDADFGGPLWQLGNRFYDPLDDGRILAVRTLGADGLVIVDPVDGTARTVDLPLTGIRLGARNGSRVLLTGGSSALCGGLRMLDLDDGTLTDVRRDVDSMPDAAYVPIAEARTFHGARDVHSFVYPPRNDDYDAPAGEKPPYIAVVHGGPTGHSSGGYSPIYSYFTSRGIGIIDVNYGGSSGYGREYRNRLRGQWGVVDVEDVIAAVRGIADAGLADAARVAIRGGSAGGFTVLAALTRSAVFAAGASYYGVSDLATLAAETHDFESRYTDGLVGPLPEASALYTERSPITHVNDLTTPVLLLQGLDDEIVPPAQSELFRDALAAKGLPHAYLAYEGESHGFRRAETIIDATESELSFYGQVLGFDPPDVPRLTLS
ncbi:S9 family peptidase [Glaciihabitans sp. INWT7]|uniref:prolyl oligopeptidase family serine peptidase n=1 Tax=Glaciihabitans sp. INWT7 TaxID=2596912 RepID=UPI0016297BAB|nr:prolyl oligopeptidase family serine peptidase [Glaciihabitans sp. INWT7]QNE47332.1 S9 family peptidase [Glaciihabitans sp. INWT7]